MTPFGRAYRWLIVVCVVGLFFMGSLKAWEYAIIKVAQAKKWNIPTLVYHRFGDDRYPSTNTNSADFEEQLKWLKDNNYESLTVSEAYRKSNKQEGKYICLTIDDGYRSFIDHGLPLLQKYGLKATLFVNTESVGWGDYLTWEEIKHIQSQGIEIGNHSHNHSHFVDQSEADRALYFQSDLKLSEELFVKYLGKKPLVYAYPYGEFSQDIIDVLNARHYKLAFAQFSGVWNEMSDRKVIPRFPMSGRVSMEKFTSRVQMQPFKIKDNKQVPIVVDENQKDIALILEYNQEVYPGPVNCFINGAPTTDFKKENGALWIKYKITHNQRRQLITLTTQDRNGLWCWFSQLVINPEVTE